MRNTNLLQQNCLICLKVDMAQQYIELPLKEIQKFCKKLDNNKKGQVCGNFMVPGILVSVRSELDAWYALYIGWVAFINGRYADDNGRELYYKCMHGAPVVVQGVPVSSVFYK